MLAMLATALGALAVTDAEMDEARAITAKFYVRYINNGAGYLDNWQPSSMAQLEKKLSNKTDRDNLKKFRQVATPTDYAPWDKDRLIAYWSDAFFKENGSQLDPKAADNAMCKKQIKQTLGRMTIAAPAPATAPEAPAETAPAQAEPAADTPSPADTELAIDEELANVDAEIQEANNEVEREAAAPANQSASGTWVYILVLAILVAVVIFLVIFASRTMKGPKKKAQTPEADYDKEDEENTEVEMEEEEIQPVYTAPRREYTAPDIRPQRQSAAEDSRMREKYAEALAAKSEEIRTITRQLSDMEQLTSRLKEENRSLTAEVDRLRKYVTSFQPSGSAETPDEGAGRQRHHHQSHQPHHHQQQRPEGEPREIYLGRVNSKGIFVRADRHAVDGQSIYKLTTTNGHTGTYTLLQNPIIEEQVLDDPGKWLAGGCFAKDIFDTEGRDSICLETPGVAVFRDGAWRVEKKAKIRYC